MQSALYSNRPHNTYIFHVSKMFTESTFRHKLFSKVDIVKELAVFLIINHTVWKLSGWEDNIRPTEGFPAGMYAKSQFRIFFNSRMLTGKLKGKFPKNESLFLLTQPDPRWYVLYSIVSRGSLPLLTMSTGISPTPPPTICEIKCP